MAEKASRFIREEQRVRWNRRNFLGFSKHGVSQSYGGEVKKDRDGTWGAESSMA